MSKSQIFYIWQTYLFLYTYDYANIPYFQSSFFLQMTINCKVTVTNILHLAAIIVP